MSRPCVQASCRVSCSWRFYQAAACLQVTRYTQCIEKEEHRWLQGADRFRMALVKGRLALTLVCGRRRITRIAGTRTSPPLRSRKGWRDIQVHWLSKEGVLLLAASNEDRLWVHDNAQNPNAGSRVVMQGRTRARAAIPPAEDLED